MLKIYKGFGNVFFLDYPTRRIINIIKGETYEVTKEDSLQEIEVEEDEEPIYD